MDISKICYFYSKVILSLVFILNFVLKSKYNSLEKNIYFMLTFAIFLFFSHMYEKKREIFSTTYLCYVLFNTLSFNILPYTYTTNKYMQETIVRFPTSRIPKDHYIMYAKIYIIISLLFLVIFYKSKKKYKEEYKEEYKEFNTESANKILISYFIILLPLYMLKSSTFILGFVPFTTYFIVIFFTQRKVRKKLNFKIGFLISIIIIMLNLKTRYILIQFILPIILSIIIILSLKKIYFKKIKTFIYIFIILGGINTYGVISELRKLSKLDQIFNFEIVKFYALGQSYRLFGIWTVLCGNVIDYVKENGYYMGLSYIKILSKLFNFEYINLSVLSAKLFSVATYAQIGLIGEGYANFGLIGGVLNSLIVLIIIEWTFLKFINKKTMVNLLFLTVPFTKVMLDGGGINSVIFGMITIFLTYIFRIRILDKWRK